MPEPDESPTIIDAPKPNGKLARYTPQPKRKTSTERVKRFRERHGRGPASVTEVPDVSVVPETLTQNRETHSNPSVVTIATFVAALALASCSAYFSIVGL